MADYDWFINEPASPSDELIYGEANGYTVFQIDPQAHQLNRYARQMMASEVWCDWCQCMVRPMVVSMRQHRRVCVEDPRVAGEQEDTSEHIKELIDGICKLKQSRTYKN